MLGGPPELCDLDHVQIRSMDRHLLCNAFITTAMTPLFHLGEAIRDRCL